MSIFFWFLIIAVITLALNMFVILRMQKQRDVRILPVFAILFSGYLLAALLYLVTVTQGVQILEQTQAASLDIEPQSYQTAANGTHTAYAFCSKEGMEFRFNDTALLLSDVPEHPSVVEIYLCKTRTGFSGCYLSEGSAVCYILK